MYEYYIENEYIMKKNDKKNLNINYSKFEIINTEELKNTYENTEEDIENDYNPFSLKKIQNYQPIYSLFFKMNENNYSSVCFNNKFHFINKTHVKNIETEKLVKKETFIKYSPLLDPVKYMTGKIKNLFISDDLIQLPNIHSNETNCNLKLLSLNNSSYVDGFFCFLSSKLLNEFGFINGIDYHGTYLAIQEKFKYNIKDDCEYLLNSSYFHENLNKLHKIGKGYDIFSFNENSRKNKKKINILNTSKNELNLQYIDCLDETDITNQINQLTEITEKELIYENPNNDKVVQIENDESDTETSNSTNNSDETDDDSIKDEIDEMDIDENNEDIDDEKINDNNNNNDEKTNNDNNDINTCDNADIESEQYEDSNEEEDETDELNAYIKNFPIQMICLEKCQGTLDELFEEGQITEENGSSVLLQIIMTLLTYQKTFEFTHNDLHTNNIMYMNTDTKYLFYCFNGIYYKIPTFGKIFKIIDFGRSIYKFKGQLFCSDSFEKNGDASTQYNFEPFYNPKKRRIMPNYSFDLCRLGCSIYDFILDDDDEDNDEENEFELDELQKTIKRWCEDDNGDSILYKKNGEERYKNFKLYKMIARNVHEHTPEKQLEFDYFKKHIFTPTKKELKHIINIDDIPSFHSS